MVSCDAGMSPQREQIVVNNRIVSFLRWGSGESTIVLLHGITSSARTWWRVAPAIANLGYQVVAFDMPGHGESTLIGSHDIPSIAAHMVAACQQLQLNIHGLIGHSWGGATALVASAHLSLQCMIVIDPAIAMHPDHGASVVDRYAEGVGDPPQLTTQWLSTRHKQWHRCDVLWKAEALKQCRREAVTGLFLQSGEWNLTDTFQTIVPPTLCLVAAAAATVIPSESHAPIRTALTTQGGRWEQIDGTDHNMFRGGFDVTIPHIMSWIKEHTT